jgi:uracil-DNA glycosylase
MKQNFDVEEIKQKMFEKLKPSGWDRIFKSFIFSSDFESILNSLWNLSSSGKRFTPPLKDIFRAFEECPLDSLKVVVVGQDPYPQFGVADGIAFSCSKTNQLQPSLRFILKEVDKTVYTNSKVSENLDLARWSNQGILMLNTALTTEVNKIGQHYSIWKTFLAYLFDYLSNHVNGLVYVYMGKQAKEWSDLINDNNYKFFVSHPASAAYNGSVWDSKNVFVEVNELLKKNYNQEIIW